MLQVVVLAQSKCKAGKPNNLLCKRSLPIAQRPRRPPQGGMHGCAAMKRWARGPMIRRLCVRREINHIPKLRKKRAMAGIDTNYTHLHMC